MSNSRFAGAAASTFRLPFLALLLAVVSPAQTPGQPAPGQPAPGPGTQGPAVQGQPAPGGAAAKTPAGTINPVVAPPVAPSAEPVYGRIVADEAALRCWPSAVTTPPVYEGKLVKGDVVQLGRSENGFREVLLPIGPLGYTSERFAKAGEDGVVRTVGSKVAFRFRPRTSEAPVAQLPEGTELQVVDIADGWYKARVAGVEAWVANAEVEVVASDPEIVAAYEALGAAHKQAVQARLDAIAEAERQAEQARIDLEAVRVVEAAFGKELQKPVEVQQFAPLEQALAKAVEKFDEDSEARTAAAALQKRIETQKWIKDAFELVNAPPPEPVEASEPPQPKDRLSRFESIGWLRYESRLTGPGIYYLEKGGRQQHLLTCNNGRFDLALFVGCEIGVVGPRRTPLGDTLSTLDVERLEVLGTRPR